MIYRIAFGAVLVIFLFISAASAQKAEITVSLNETFFDALLDSVFQNFNPPEFSIAKSDFYRRDAETPRQIKTEFQTSNLSFLENSATPRLSGKNTVCNESVKILREINGVRTAVRFREGKIFVPLAFSGSYSPPFIGCVEFAGWDPSLSYLIAEAEMAQDPGSGIRHSEKGIQAIGKIDEGKRVRVVLSEPQVEQGDAPTLVNLREALIAVYGTDYGVHNVTWLSRFTDAACDRRGT